jgi:hypothetical protein
MQRRNGTAFEEKARRNMRILRSLRDALPGGLGQVIPLFYEEVAVVRYIALDESIAGFPVPQPGSITNDRHFFNLAAPGVNDRTPTIVSFRTSHTGSPRFQALLNNSPLFHHTFRDEGPHSWQRLLAAGTLKPEGNSLDFVVFDGTVTFSDVIIVYTAKELTVKLRRPDPVLTQ